MWHLYRVDNRWRETKPLSVRMGKRTLSCVVGGGNGMCVSVLVCVCVLWWRTTLIPAAIRTPYSNLFFKGHINHIQSDFFLRSLSLFLSRSPFNPLQLFKNVNEVDKMQYVYLILCDSQTPVCVCVCVSVTLSTQNQVHWSPCVYGWYEVSHSGKRKKRMGKREIEMKKCLQTKHNDNRVFIPLPWFVHIKWVSSFTKSIY